MSEVKVDLKIDQTGDAVYKLADIDSAASKASASYAELERKSKSANASMNQAPKPQAAPPGYDPVTKRWTPPNQQRSGQANSNAPIVIPPTLVMPGGRGGNNLTNAPGNVYDPIAKKWVPPDQVTPTAQAKPNQQNQAQQPQQNPTQSNPNNLNGGAGSYYDPIQKKWVLPNQLQPPKSAAQAFAEDLERRRGNGEYRGRNPFKGLDQNETGGRVAKATEATGRPIGERFRESNFATGMAKRSESTMLGRMAGGGGAAGPATIALGVFVAATEALGKFADAVNIGQNASLTAAQQQTALAEEFIPGVANLRKFSEAMNGTTETLRRNKEIFASASLNQHLYERVRTEERANRRELDTAKSREYGLNAISIDKYQGGKFDRSTLQGEQGYAEYGQRLEARDREVKAKQELIAANQDAMKQKNRVSDAKKAEQAAQFQRDQDQKKVDELKKYENTFGRRRKAELDTAFNKLELSNQNLIDRRKAVEEEVTKSKEKQTTALEKQRDLQQALIEKQKVELSILEQKEQRMAEGQTRLGEMNLGQYEQSKQAALYIKEHGIENATPELIDAARQVAPGMIRKQAENFGEGRAKELAGLGIPDYERDYKDGSNLRDVRARIDEVKADVRITMQINERELAKQFTDLIAQNFRELISVMKTTIEAEVKQQRNGLQKQQSTQY